ncbi:hypothetical protein PVAG01_06148 [Phlyctema vagabunda]|uniref:Uncharacterized protein n=1 Tax=Phlyctema vagabunda TaxID=108571 RepID=A0ABR4PF81_9HELO
MTEVQEREVIERCIELATSLTGKRPKGWRAPLYQLREHTIKVLEDHGFLYDSSLTHHDSQPYFLPSTSPIKPIDFSPNVSAKSWMHPLPPPAAPTSKTLVELPANWYMEDMTPLQYLPSAPNSQGYVGVSNIMDMWKARFEFLYHEFDDEVAGDDGDRRVRGTENDNQKVDFVFPLVLHPDTSGMAHVIGMIDNMITWLKSRGREGEVEVEFARYEDVASEWKSQQQ